MTSDVTREQMVTVSRNLRRLIDTMGITRLEVYNQLEISGSTLDNWLDYPGRSGMKGKNLDKLTAFFRVTPEWLLSAHDDEAIESAVKHNAPGRRPIDEMTQRIKDAEKENLVRDETCKGCRYYSSLEGWGTTKCCDYTFMTGKLKHNPPATCEVKEIGPRAVRNIFRSRKKQEPVIICSRCKRRRAAPGHKQCAVCLEYGRSRRHRDDAGQEPKGEKSDASGREKAAAGKPV